MSERREAGRDASLARAWTDRGLGPRFLTWLNEAVREESRRQFAKWGVQSHSPERWGVITAEEFGETMKELCELVFRPSPRANVAFTHEAVQTITLLAKMLEMLGTESLEAMGTPP